MHLPVFGSIINRYVKKILMLSPTIRTVVITMVFSARDVVHSLGAAMGNLTAIRRSVAISARKRPEMMAQVRIMYQIILQMKHPKRTQFMVQN